MKNLEEYLVNKHNTEEKNQENIYIENYDEKGNVIDEENANN